MSSATKSLLLAASFLFSACSITIQTEFSTPTATVLVTSTLPPVSTPPPTETSTALPPEPTIVPLRGTTSTQLNVRAEPSTVSETLGVIAANTEVQIVGRDPGGNWWQILYEAGTDGKAWVAAQYVETEAGPEVPVIGGGGRESDVANSAMVIPQLNIRSGPGTGFNSLGVLNANDTVNLTGKNRDGSWLQIEFANGPNGRGWVNAAFVRTEDVESLPVVSDLGEPIGTGTPADTPLPPTPTLVPAPMDFDSADAPAKTILFERAGTQTLIYNGDVSQPDGDAEDWIAFTPYGDTALVSVRCAGNGTLLVEFVGSGSSLMCDESEKVVSVRAGAAQLVHIRAVAASDALQYVRYTLTIMANP